VEGPFPPQLSDDITVAMGLVATLLHDVLLVLLPAIDLLAGNIEHFSS
jgi:hypothetical protein